MPPLYPFVVFVLWSITIWIYSRCTQWNHRHSKGHFPPDIPLIAKQVYAFRLFVFRTKTLVTVLDSDNINSCLWFGISLGLALLLPEAGKQYSETWELGTPTGLWKTLLNTEVVLFLRSISVCWIGLGTGVAVLNSQVVPISQVVLKTGFTVHMTLERPFT